MRARSIDLAILLSVTGAIAGALLGPTGWPLHALCKPLATALIALRLLRGAPPSSLRRALLLGLGFSWIGDVLLMWPSDLFLGGLIAFLLAHVCYIAAFSREPGWRYALPGLLVFSGVAAGVLSLLFATLPEGMRAPVSAYVAVLVVMASFASAHSLRRRLQPWPAAAVGACCFVLSDSLLAIDRFATPLPGAALWVLSTYFLAQWCLVRSAEQALPVATGTGRG